MFDKIDLVSFTAKVRTYMLEKSRVVVRGRREQNFHIFNYLLAGASREQQQDFCLDDPGVYRCLSQSK